MITDCEINNHYGNEMKQLGTGGTIKKVMEQWGKKYCAEKKMCKWEGKENNMKTPEKNSSTSRLGKNGAS